MEQQINDELLAKMSAEQEAYRADLLAMPPEEILNHTWEYSAREDILEAVDAGVFPENQVKSLLKSPSPLADVVKEYRDLECPNEEILVAVENAASLHMEPPIYRQDYKYAVEHGERDAYFAPQKAYSDCTKAIESAINYHFDGMHLGKDCIAQVMGTYSPERVAGVLAYTVQQKAWDARFSRNNCVWAISIDTSHMGIGPYRYICESHPAVLDGFISMFRQEVLERDKAQKAAATAQHKPKERSDDFEL